MRLNFSDKFSQQDLLTSLSERKGFGNSSAFVEIISACILGVFACLAHCTLGTPRMARDVKAIALVLVFLQRKRVYKILLEVIPPETYVCALLGTAIHLSRSIWTTRDISTPGFVSDDDNDEPRPNFLKPMIFPCRTTHARFFPEKHSFSYSYLFVGVPIGSRKTIGNILSTDAPVNENSQGSARFSIVAEDYLKRGTHVNGLLGKLEDYLISQGQDLHDYPFAYLVTAPRFLGFSFNPVSFWYLYDKDRQLSAMILEVNNTFDERRMYFVPRRGSDPTSDGRFANEWMKDFHVSPFNDRDGSYSLTARNPFSSPNGEGNKVDNSIVLRSLKGKPKIVARVFSTEPGLDATKFSRLQSISFAARWWWVGFMTNPRILREARILWRKKLKLFYRPEVFASSIGRNESTVEKTLESYLGQFLQNLATTSSRIIRYTPAAGQHRGQRIELVPQAQPNSHATVKPIDIRVLTPAFYAELARNSDFRQVWETRCFKAANGEAMVHISDSADFKTVLDSFTLQPFRVERRTSLQIFNQELRRASPIVHAGIKAVFSSPAKHSSQYLTEHVGFAGIVQNISPDDEIRLFDKVSLIVLLADRLALGFTSLLKMYARSAWLVCICVTANHLGCTIFDRDSPSEYSVFVKIGVELLLLQLLGSVLAAME